MNYIILKKYHCLLGANFRGFRGLGRPPNLVPNEKKIPMHLYEEVFKSMKLNTNKSTVTVTIYLPELMKTQCTT